MLKFIAPLIAAVSVAWAGPASALVAIQQGFIEEATSGPFRYGFVDVPLSFIAGGGHYLIEMTSDAYIDEASFLEYYSYHFHQHAPDGTEIGGNNYDGSFWVPSGDPRISRTANGFLFDLVVQMDYVTGGPGEYSEEWWFAGGAGGQFYFNEASIGQAYEFRVTAVPEPATWALMIVGFGIVASRLRQRRSYAAI